MILIPFETYYLRSPYDEHKAISLLESKIEPERMRLGIIGPAAIKPYEGSSTGFSFKIRRILNYSNSFAPVIIGQIESDGIGSLIRIRMRMSMAINLFMLIWLIFPVAILISILLFATGEQNIMGAIFGTLFYMAFALTIMYIAYIPERKKSREFLKDLFKAEEI